MSLSDQYDAWVKAPGPQTLAPILQELDPVLRSEVSRINGPQPVLHARAKLLALNAVKSYNPASGAQLRSWVVTSLQPLSRYNNDIRVVRAPEVATRQAVHVSKARQELGDTLGREPSDEEVADHVGISVPRVRKLSTMVRPSVAEGSMAASSDDEEGGPAAPAVYTTNKLPLAAEVVYTTLSPLDRAIFDHKTGSHGKTVAANQDIARRFRVSPAYISQRSAEISRQITEMHRSSVL